MIFYFLNIKVNIFKYFLDENMRNLCESSNTQDFKFGPINVPWSWERVMSVLWNNDLCNININN